MNALTMINSRLNFMQKGRGATITLTFLLIIALFALAACSLGEGGATETEPEADAVAESTAAPEEESAETSDDSSGEAASAPSSGSEDSTDESADAEEEAGEEVAEEASEDEAVSDASDSEASSDDSEAPAEISEGEASQLAPAERNGMYDAPPEMVIDTEKFYYATIKTEQGDIKIQLFAERAPLTVNNFVFLAREGYYNNTIFHRVLENFMAQAGDPLGLGSGGPGYEFEDEFFPGLGFDRAGLLAMANRGPQTNGSQFFLTFAPTPWLDGNHTIFGEVVEGMDVLNSITLRDPGNPTHPGDEIYSIVIEEAESSTLPEPTPAPPTPTPLPTPTPFAPTGLGDDANPVADLEPAERVNIFNTAPEMTIDTEKTYSAVISTSQGDLTVELYADEAPVAVNNFVVLAELGYYDGQNIALVNPEIALIGAPSPDDPTQDVGYLFEAEKGITKELAIGSMAYLPNRDDPRQSSGSQILLALIAPPRGVEAQFSFFGQIVDSDDILTSLTIEDTIDSITIESE